MKASLATCKFEQTFAYWASTLLEEPTLTFSLGTGFTNFTRTNETCSTSGCSGGIVIMERTCLNRTNCTGLTNNTIAYGEKEFVERLCSITENQMMGGCIPGKYWMTRKATEAVHILCAGKRISLNLRKVNTKSLKIRQTMCEQFHFIKTLLWKIFWNICWNLLLVSGLTVYQTANLKNSYIFDNHIQIE